jgi:hypothetical protein
MENGSLMALLVTNLLHSTTYLAGASPDPTSGERVIDDKLAPEYE